MVVVFGTSLQYRDLPLADTIEYVVQTTLNKSIVTIMQRTGVLDNSTNIYAQVALKAYIPREYLQKTIFFETDTILLELLETGVVPKQAIEYTQSTSAIEENKIIDSTVEKPISSLKKLKKVVIPKELLKEKSLTVSDVETAAATDITATVPDILETSAFLSIDTESAEVTPENENYLDLQNLISELKSKLIALQLEKDMLQQTCAKQLQDIINLQETISTLQDDNTDKVKYETQLSTLTFEVNTAKGLYEETNTQLKELQNQIKTEHIQFENDKLEMQSSIDNLQDEKQKLVDYIKQQEKPSFSLFEDFVKVPKAVLSDIYTNNLEGLQNYNASKTYILAFGTGNSMYDSMYSLRNLIINENPLVRDLFIVDFTTNPWLSSSLGIKNTTSVLDILTNPDLTPLINKVHEVQIVKGVVFHDIALLMYPWNTVLPRLQKLAGNRKLVILLGELGTFAVNYTIHSLCSYITTVIAVDTTSAVLESLRHWMPFFEKQSLHTIAFNYVDDLKEMLTALTNYTHVVAQRAEFNLQDVYNCKNKKG